VSGYPLQDHGVAERLKKVGQNIDRPIGPGLLVCATLQFLADQLKEYLADANGAPSYKNACGRIAAMFDCEDVHLRAKNVGVILSKCKDWERDISGQYCVKNSIPTTPNSSTAPSLISEAPGGGPSEPVKPKKVKPEKKEPRIERTPWLQAGQSLQDCSPATMEDAFLKDSKSFTLSKPAVDLDE
jgi:hypothetical protein